MDYRKLFPLVDFANPYTFDKCESIQDFLVACVDIYFFYSGDDERVKESCLSVYMDCRDHYPDYLQGLSPQICEKLDAAVEVANPKVIKLRRIVISAISKVA